MSEMSDERRAEIEAVREAIIAVVDDHLQFNVVAYGKAWTGEREDTRFIVADAAEKAIAALDRLRDARGDDEGPAAEIVKRLRYSDGIAPDEAVREIADWVESQFPAARSPQGEDHEGPMGPRLPVCEMCGQAVKVQRGGKLVCPACGDDGEDHETDIEAFAASEAGRAATARYHPETVADALRPVDNRFYGGAQDAISILQSLLKAALSSPSRVSAPKADEKQEASQDDERRH